MYYVGDGRKVRYFEVYVTLGSKFGSFLIVGTKNDVRYFGGFKYFEGTLLLQNGYVHDTVHTERQRNIQTIQKFQAKKKFSFFFSKKPPEIHISPNF
jgi:hypothetical protein